MIIMFRSRPEWLYKQSTWNDESDTFNGWARAACYDILQAASKAFKNEPTEKNYDPSMISGTWIK